MQDEQVLIACDKNVSLSKSRRAENLDIVRIAHGNFFIDMRRTDCNVASEPGDHRIGFLPRVTGHLDEGTSRLIQHLLAHQYLVFAQAEFEKFKANSVL